MIINGTKKAAFRCLTIFLSLVLLVTAFPFSVNSVYYEKADYNDIKDEDLEAMREQLAEYDRMLDEIKKNLKENEKLQATAAETRKLYLEAEAIYNDQLKDLEKAKLYYDGEIERIGKEIAEIQIEYDREYETFLDLLRMSYEEGTANFIEILLGAERDPLSSQPRS